MADLRGVEVRVRRPCSECENGVVQHSDWAAYWADEAQQERERVAERAPPPRNSGAEYEKWWRGRGYDPLLPPRYQGRSREGLPVPPEEVPCPECEGSTWVESWVSLADLLRPVHEGLATLDSVVLGMKVIG